MITVNGYKQYIDHCCRKYQHPPPCSSSKGRNFSFFFVTSILDHSILTHSFWLGIQMAHRRGMKK